MAKAPVNFAEKVKEARKQLGLSQEELAHEPGRELLLDQPLGKQQDGSLQTQRGGNSKPFVSG